MKKHLSTGLCAFALAAFLAGCTGGGGATTVTSPAPTSAQEPAPTLSAGSPATDAPPDPGPVPTADLMTAESPAGRIVVDGKGMSVYFFTRDTKDSGTSACTGGCLTLWPPVITSSEAPAAEGVTAPVGTITTPDGRQQLTINGLPVYYYANDAAPGDIAGQGVGGVWYLVAPSGERVGAPAGS